PLNAPAITAQRTVFSHHAMARDDERRGVRRARTRPRACCLRLPNLPRPVRVGARLSERDPLQLLPHAPLERRRADVERQVEMRLATIEIRENGVHEPHQLSVFLPL